MKRIVFLDYVRVFACFLVIVVHASENFYGAAGSTDMAGPQSFLANESDRLWVSVYDGFSRMAVPLFIIVSAFLLTPMKEGLTSWQFYRQRSIRILPPFLLFMVLYSTLPLLWGQIDAETSVKDLSRILLNFPTQAGHLWFMYPLISLYLFIPVISPWLKKSYSQRRTFLHRPVSVIDLHAVSQPLVGRSLGTMFLERIPHAVLFLRLPRLPGHGTLYTHSPHLEPFQTPQNRNRLDDYRGSVDDLLVLYPGDTRGKPVHSCYRNRMGFLYHQLCAPYYRYLPDVQLYKPAEVPAAHHRNIETQLRYVPDAHILARPMGNGIQA